MSMTSWPSAWRSSLKCSLRRYPAWSEPIEIFTRSRYLRRPRATRNDGAHRLFQRLGDAGPHDVVDHRVERRPLGVVTEAATIGEPARALLEELELDPPQLHDRRQLGPVLPRDH